MISAHAFAGSTPLSVKILRLTFAAINAAALRYLAAGAIRRNVRKGFGYRDAARLGN